MDPVQVEQLVGRYQEAIKKLDSKIDRLDRTEKSKYEQRKERFIAQIRSWQRASEREFNQLESNLEESFNELESVWYSAQRQ